MALVSRRPFDHDLAIRDDDKFFDSWKDWPMDWPRPGEMVERFRRDSDRWWHDWPESWPQRNTIMPRFNDQLDQIDKNWRNDPFWKGMYPIWAEPTFKDGVDVKVNVVSDQEKFAVEIDAYQFRPEELQVKTMDDTLIIEGQHQDKRDEENYTKMYFIRKYRLPNEVDLGRINSTMDNNGKLYVSAPKINLPPIDYNREKRIPIQQQSINYLPTPAPRDTRRSSNSSGYGNSPTASHAGSGNRIQETAYEKTKRGISYDRNNFQSRNYSDDNFNRNNVYHHADNNRPPTSQPQPFVNNQTSPQQSFANNQNRLDQKYSRSREESFASAGNSKFNGNVRDVPIKIETRYDPILERSQSGMSNNLASQQPHYNDYPTTTRSQSSTRYIRKMTVKE
uniref:SHSP domain-containing protein n=1 Tax=Rhabditophanes sp. KR3021 TaxID=114890 RepID=A0AC35U2Y3_9BILA